LGDQFIFRNDLSRAGKKVGIDGGVCTLVGLEPMVSATLQCVATAELPRGRSRCKGWPRLQTAPRRSSLRSPAGQVDSAKPTAC
jgi:hypothetical protein